MNHSLWEYVVVLGPLRRVPHLQHIAQNERMKLLYTACEAILGDGPRMIFFLDTTRNADPFGWVDMQMDSGLRNR